MALVLGDDVAAARLNIPRRTVSFWRSQPAYQTLAPEAQAQLGRMMWEGVAVGVRAVVEGLMDPTTQLRDRAVAVGILSDKALLLSGMATSRSESFNGSVGDDAALNDEEARQLRDWLDTVEAATDDELREMAPAVCADMTRMLRPGSVEEVPDVVG